MAICFFFFYGLLRHKPFRDIRTEPATLLRKRDQTTTPGIPCPTFCEQCVGECCETGPTVYRPYPRTLKSVTDLTICGCHYKVFSLTVLSPQPRSQALSFGFFARRSTIQKGSDGNTQRKHPKQYVTTKA